MTLSSLKAVARRMVYAVADAMSPRLLDLSEPEKTYLLQLKSDAVAWSIDDGTHDEWVKNIATLRSHILHDDPREFLRWPVVMRSMAVGPWETFVLHNLSFLRRNNWSRWKDAIVESRVGRPYRYLFYPRSSANLINMAYHVALFEKTTGQSINQLDSIVEFGGGYGCLCRLTRHLGYAGPYHIFDLPAFLALQRYYLRTNEVQDVSYLADLSALRAVIEVMPNRRNSLFVATWSLSETPSEAREAILELTAAFGWFLLAYQENFADIDNKRFFGDWTTRRSDIAWVTLPVCHLPGNAYLIGRPSY